MPERAINTRSATGCMLVLIPAALTMSALFVAWPIILGVTLAIAGGNIWQSYEWAKTSRSLDPVFQQLIVQNRGEITSLDLAVKANISGGVSNRYLTAKANEFGTGSRQHPDRGQVYYFVTVSTLGRIFDDSELESPAMMPATNPVAAFAPTATPPAAQPVAEVVSPVKVKSPITVSEPAIANPTAEVTAPPVVSDPIPVVELPTPTVGESIDSTPPPEIAASAIVAEIDPDVAQPPSEIDRDLPPASPQVLILQSELAKRLDVHSSTIYKRRSEPNFTDWTRNRDPEGVAWGYTEATKEYYRVDT
jgi:hypothetical protein